MARAGQVIENSLTGERLTFVEVAADTGGRRLVMETVWTRPGHRAAEHIHPSMSERFDVLEGRARLRVDGEETELGPGESLTVPPGARHVAWNPTDGAVRLQLTFVPALRWEEFVERLFTGDRAELPQLLREYPAEIDIPGR